MKRPDVLYGETVSVKTKCGTIKITMNENKDGELDEIIFTLGGTGSCSGDWTPRLGKCFTWALRNGLDTKRLLKWFAPPYPCVGAQSHEPSCFEVAHNVLKKYIKEKKDQDGTQK